MWKVANDDTKDCYRAYFDIDHAYGITGFVTGEDGKFRAKIGVGTDGGGDDDFLDGGLYSTVEDARAWCDNSMRSRETLHIRIEFLKLEYLSQILDAVGGK